MAIGEAPVIKFGSFALPAHETGSCRDLKLCSSRSHDDGALGFPWGALN